MDPNGNKHSKEADTAMSEWHRYDSHLIPAFHERFERRWGKGTAPFLNPEAHEEPLPRAQWINPVTLRNDAYRKAVAHAKEFLFGSH